ncbi:MAG: transcription antitermination factor NusB [Bacteroidia bacterium]|nr:transcription antitermination factor NusB [Bacteroidia bacterium]MDW8348017.1 transcription antitermination factor NusB [Bacteroidia bacterium]
MNQTPNTNKRKVRIVAFNMVYAVLVNQLDPNQYWLNNTQYAKTLQKNTQNQNTNEDEYLQYLQNFIQKGKENENYILLHDLYHQALRNTPEYIQLITRFLENWQWERVSTVERVLMILCLTEWLCFPQIPVKVSLNEYMEMAKIYANPDESHKFINGVLDKILVYLQENKQIHKIGKGTITQSKKKL